MLRITDIKETGTRDIKADNKAVRDSIIEKESRNEAATSKGFKESHNV